ncbi:hypothetical protein B296_00039740 [Ensete ventricosum]|uniref:Uncharacterized protein n=1 Tax=Ensete ventricosum TaxID=4639 RepID=A0A426ZQJ3_ENSVE|nr:hypothetical protein B296_00039740 [Ensete ventricosum]
MRRFFSAFLGLLLPCKVRKEKQFNYPFHHLENSVKVFAASRKLSHSPTQGAFDAVAVDVFTGGWLRSPHAREPSQRASHGRARARDDGSKQQGAVLWTA